MCWPGLYLVPTQHRGPRVVAVPSGGAAVGDELGHPAHERGEADPGEFSTSQ